MHKTYLEAPADLQIYLRYSKDCDLDQTEVHRKYWDDPSLWTVDAAGERIPNEVKAMFDLRGRNGSEYIVKILNWRIAEDRLAYRLYLEVSLIDR